MKAICSINRTGKAGSSPASPGSDFPYDPTAPEYSGYALFMSGASALLDVDQISEVQAVNDVYVLFGQPVKDASVVTYSVTHIGIVLTASVAIGDIPDARKATIKFAPLLKAGQGQFSSCFATTQWRSWNAKVLPIEQMLSSQMVLRPAYEFAVSDEVEVTKSAQWSVSSPEPHTGTPHIIRKVPADTPGTLISEDYQAITFDVFIDVKSVAVRPEPGNPMCCFLKSVDDRGEELVSYADFANPAAIVETLERTDLYWLAWHKPNGSPSCAVRLLRSAADAVPQDTVMAASPVVTVFGGTTAI